MQKSNFLHYFSPEKGTEFNKTVKQDHKIFHINDFQQNNFFLFLLKN